MFAIAPTDANWFQQLRAGPAYPVVNFWTPTPWRLKGLATGAKFYFLLKAPIRKLGGHGIFEGYEDLAADEAWGRYGTANGVSNRAALTARVTAYASTRSTLFVPGDNPKIGCILLREAVFLDDEDFVTPASLGVSFPKEVVKLKYFEGDGLVGLSPDSAAGPAAAFDLIEGAVPSYRSAQQKHRKGQSAFRQQVLAAYGGRCAVTGEATPELLEAAHLQPYINEQSNHIQNGIALRVDLHRLFDLFLITIDDSLRLRVSPRVTSPEYRAFEGRQLRMPSAVEHRPSSRALSEHRLTFVSS